MRLLNLKTVLVADDLVATSEVALRTAAALRDGSGATLHVAHVAPPTAPMAARGGVRAEFVQSMEDNARAAGVGRAYTPHVLEGSVPEAISALAERISADVIVTGRRTRAALPIERPLGGTAFAIMTGSRLPCLVVSNPMRIPLKRVLVAIDYSDAARGALIVALSWASALRDRSQESPTLTALHVAAEAPGAPRTQDLDHELDILRRASGDWAGVDVRGMTITAEDAVTAIAMQADASGADLLVLGTRGKNPRSDAALGSVSAAVLGVAKAPVLVVPPAIWRDYARDMNEAPSGASVSE
jgi:nucleotide-binding universal stress UspA family protein